MLETRDLRELSASKGIYGLARFGDLPATAADNDTEDHLLRFGRLVTRAAAAKADGVVIPWELSRADQDPVALNVAIQIAATEGLDGVVSVRSIADIGSAAAVAERVAAIAIDSIDHTDSYLVGGAADVARYRGCSLIVEVGARRPNSVPHAITAANHAHVTPIILSATLGMPTERTPSNAMVASAIRHRFVGVAAVGIAQYPVAAADLANQRTAAATLVRELGGRLSVVAGVLREDLAASADPFATFLAAARQAAAHFDPATGGLSRRSMEWEPDWSRFDRLDDEELFTGGVFRALAATRDIEPGERLLPGGSAGNLTSIRTSGSGIPAWKLGRGNELWVARGDIRAGTVLLSDDVEVNDGRPPEIPEGARWRNTARPRSLLR